jgi:hypothetical protein
VSAAEGDQQALAAEQADLTNSIIVLYSPEVLLLAFVFEHPQALPKK